MKRKSHKNLRSFIDLLKRENELDIVTAPVDPHLEIAEIHRQVVASNGKALLFTRVKNSSFPVVTNLFGSEKRMELAFPDKPEVVIQDLIHLLTQSIPPSIQQVFQKRDTLARFLSLGTSKKTYAPVIEQCITPCDLTALPLLTCWPGDGGPFITLPLVYTEGNSTKKINNLGMYRVQRFDKTIAGLHFQIAKGGGFHYVDAERHGRALPVSVFLGGPPSLILAAIAPLPENVSEILFASLLMGKKLSTTHIGRHPHPVFSECEFAIQGYARPYERKLEGPFGDHYGYYGEAHEYPVFHIEHIYHRKDAIYPATVVGKPIQEDLYIGNYLQKLLAPLLPVVMPSVVELWSYPETGFHSFTVARIKERYEKEALTTAFRILGEGQLALTKILFITDQPVNVQNCREVFETVLSTCSFEENLYIFANTANDTLDYTGPRLNMGSKAVFIGAGKPKRILQDEWHGVAPTYSKNICVFCKGVLCIDGIESSCALADIATYEGFAHWPLIVIVDDARKTTTSDLEFLWTVFTRFEPQTDMYFKRTNLSQNHVQYTPPIIIDARMKHKYPKEAVSDSTTQEHVRKKWAEYNISG